MNERARGALVGLLVGDALGATVEFRRPEWIARKYPQGVTEMVGRGPFQLLPGQITDDGEMALCLARSLVEEKTFSARAILRTYRKWLDSRPFDIGNTIRQALQSVDPGNPDPALVLQKANGESQANGALMRCAPLALWGHLLEEDELGQRACEEAALTHPHHLCQEINAVFVCTLARAIRQPTPATELTAWARKRAQKWGFTWLDWLDQPPASYEIQSGWVRIAMGNAFHQLREGRGFRDGLIDTVSHGGDSDTNAAIAGALLGACYGLAAIPENWVKKVLACQPKSWRPWIRRPRPRHYWAQDALTLADALMDLQPTSPPLV